jgi:hypothetical protein
MESFKKIFSDGGLWFAVTSSVLVAIIALLKWIISRVLKFYDKALEENIKEHKEFQNKIHEMDIKIVKLEDSIKLEDNIKKESNIKEEDDEFY